MSKIAWKRALSLCGSSAAILTLEQFASPVRTRAKSSAGARETVPMNPINSPEERPIDRGHYASVTHQIAAAIRPRTKNSVSPSNRLSGATFLSLNHSTDA